MRLLIFLFVSDGTKDFDERSPLHSVSGRMLLLSPWQIYILQILRLRSSQVILSIAGFILPGGVHFKAAFRMWSDCCRTPSKWLLYLIHGKCNQFCTFSMTRENNITLNAKSLAPVNATEDFMPKTAVCFSLLILNKLFKAIKASSKEQKPGQFT